MKHSMKNQYNKTVTACFVGILIAAMLYAIAFLKVPIANLIEEGEQGLRVNELFQIKTFWILLIMMTCAGASEQAVSRWASTFAEKGPGISKTAGDLAGPMAFAVLMGAARAFYGKYGDRINLDRFMIWPGTFSKASAALPKGGTAMFALLALGGDLGCAGVWIYSILFFMSSIQVSYPRILLFMHKA